MFIKDFSSSIKSYFGAFAIIKKLNLWKYFMIPAFIGFCLGAFILVSAYSFSDNIGNIIGNFWPFEFAQNFVLSLSTWIGAFVVVLIGILIYKHVLMALSAPFMTPVSEKIEMFLTGKEVNKSNSKTEFFDQLFRSIRINTRNLVLELAISLPLIIFSLIPVVGLLATAAIFYFQSFYTGFGNIDYTLERHLNYKESTAFVKKHKGIAVGNGFLFNIMLFIPLLGIIITLPLATVASTIDSLKKLESDGKISLKELNYQERLA